MYWKMAVSAWHRVSHVRRQISSALIDRYRIARETRDGRMQEVEVKLSD